MEDIITKEMFFNENTINIFTDASIIKRRQQDGTEETISCAGNVITHMGKIIDQSYEVLRHSTNNQGEMYGILMAVTNAIKYKDNFNINIFSDSKISVFGLREWIYGWVKNVKNDTLISSQNKPVMNQDIIIRIITLVLKYQVPVTLYHVNGHINPNNPDHLLSARKTFVTSNNIQNDVDLEVIKQMALFNDVVDTNSRDLLNVYEYVDVPKPTNLLNFKYKKFDIGEYSRLLR